MAKDVKVLSFNLKTINKYLIFYIKILAHCTCYHKRVKDLWNNTGI